jgi:thiol-disulfide isomerase/thioredoxin
MISTLNSAAGRLIVLTVALMLAVPAIAQDYELGDTVSDFSFNDLNGTPRTLYEHYGDAIVLNFFATWCPGCNVESASLENDIWQAYQNDGVTVIAMDMAESLAVVQNWYANQGLTYEVLMLPNYDYFYRFPAAGGLPHNVILDKNMVLQYSVQGYDLAGITDMLNSILGFNPVPTQQETWSGIKALYR